MLDSVESRGSGRLPAEFLGQSQSRTRAPRPPSHQISSRLSAPWSLLQRHSKHRSPRRRSFCAYKRNQNTVKGDRFPLDEPLSVACSAGYERCFGIVRTAPQIRSQGSRGRICPLPVPLPRSGGGAVWANSCLFKFRSRQRDFLRCTTWPIGSPHPNRRDPLSLQNRTTNPSFSSPVKSTIYVISTQHFPIM